MRGGSIRSSGRCERRHSPGKARSDLEAGICYALCEMSHISVW
ncbi:hypothetical protein CSB93_3413 [Pseudomonas paraeruginosa]|uniref:Uncharacterized protein n=1 Tax=Pseudomonas paraeruginosa TaxID=2994495 RepID=A0A2R3ITR1_9PSED|nr:hypothetical protein CSB93_3413 [Pseudomonas paraeruginosa]AWE94989.1 hypothetical protein CSC28_2192 [Pseudomonas paraeruginosa]PTC37793.1 hypothetical protein CLJ1_1948 [Pseudomonas aeruginosa]